MPFACLFVYSSVNLKLEVSSCYAVIQGWLLHRSQHESDILLGLFDRIYSDLVVFSIQNLNKKMTTLQCNEIVQVACPALCNLTFNPFTADPAKALHFAILV